MDKPKKSKSRNSDLEVEKRKQFSDRMETVFDISHPNAEYIIRADRLRTKEAQDEDIQFLKLHLKDRVGRVAGVDLTFQKTVQKKAEREEKFEIRKQRSDQEASAMMNVADLKMRKKSLRRKTYPLTHPLMRNTLKVKQKRKEQRIMLLSDFLGRFCLVIHS